MPPIFKALATIAAWALFLGGCLGTVATILSWLIKVGFIAIPPIEILVAFLTVDVSLVLAVVVMRLRQKME